MDPKTLQQAFEFYDTFGDLSLEEFKTEIKKQSITDELRDLLIELKKTEGDASSYFDELEGSVAGFIEPPIPDKLGAWTLKELIDTGGMSSVYLAERDDDQYRMKAAAKFIHFSGYDPVVVQRFRQEMQFLALLDHPNITRIIDSGVTEHGVPWYIMEYVEGMPITQYCNEIRLTLEQRLRLFVQVCDTVQHAHKNLVIHRDLKPSNIFVTSEGDVKLLDFGIAKAFSPDSAETSGAILTRDNQALMTPEYASPEQLEGSAVSTASDVYSLGVILHELITGTRPYDFEEINRVKMVNRINERPPERPSVTFRKTKTKPSGIKQGKLGRELDDILLAALRAEPDRRYASAEQLGRDISNFLNNETVMARADSRGYRFHKFVQRNRTAVALSGLSILILIGAVAAVLWQAQQTRLEAERAVAIKDFLVNMVTATNPWTNPDHPLTARDLIDQGALTIEEELDDRPDLAAELLGVIGASYQGMREDSLAGHTLSRAMALIENGAELHPVTVGEIHALYAGSLLRSGQPDEALNLTIHMLENLPPGVHTREVRSRLLSMQANAQSLLGNPAAALESAAAAADLVCDTPGRNILECINTKMDLRHFYEWAGDFEAGLTAAEFAYKLADETETGLPDPVRLAVVGSYGNALSYNAQTREAIPLLTNNSELALELYGETSYRYARALHDLTSAYIYAGRAHDALPHAERVFDIGGTSQPGNPMNSYWLHQIFQIALDLRMPDHAEHAYARYESYLPDQMSRYYVDAFDVDFIRIKALRNPGEIQVREEIESLLEEFRENRSPHLSNAALLAAEQAIEARDAASAETFLEEFNASLGSIPRSDIRPARATLLSARRLALLGEYGRAEDTAKQALNILQEIGHRESPFIAEAEAVLAGIWCKKGEGFEGTGLLGSSLQYWRDFAAISAGEHAMQQLASECEAG